MGAITVTINELRKDWLKMIETYEGMISHLEREKQAGGVVQGFEKAGRVWPQKLQAWKAECEQLLIDYPEAC